MAGGRGGVGAAAHAAGAGDVAADAHDERVSLRLRKEGAKGAVETCASTAPAGSEGRASLGDSGTGAALPGLRVGAAFPAVRDGADGDGGATARVDASKGAAVVK